MENKQLQATELPLATEIQRHKELAQFYGLLFNSKFDQVDFHCKHNGSAPSVASVMAYHRYEYSVVRETFQKLSEYHHAQYLLLDQQAKDFLNEQGTSK